MKTIFNCSQIRRVQLSKNNTSVTLEVSWIGRDDVWFARKTCTITHQEEVILEEFNDAYERISNALSIGDPFVDIEITCL